jgi:hypothetical protein
MPWDMLGDQVSACAPVREPLCGKALMGTKHVKECRAPAGGLGSRGGRTIVQPGDSQGISRCVGLAINYGRSIYRGL